MDERPAVEGSAAGSALESFQALLDQLPDGYCEIQVLFDAQRRPVDYRFLRANCHFGRLTGLQRAVGRTVQELVPARERHWFDPFGRVALTGEPIGFVHRAERTGISYEVRAYPIGGEGSDRVGVMLADVTARELGRAREIENEMRASLAVAIAQLGTFRLDPIAGRVDFDARMAEQWGLEPKAGSFTMEEIVARIHPEDIEHVLEVASAALDPARGSYEVDYRVIWPDGSEHWVFANGQAQFEGEGEDRRAVLVLGTTRDVTRRKQAEARLRESERRVATELAAAKALQHVSTRLIVGDRLDELYPHVLSAACVLMHADAASLQVLDPQSGELVLMAAQGLAAASERMWQRVAPASPSACGLALARGERVLVADVEHWDQLRDPGALAPFRLSGLRAIQSTPLKSRSGKLLGMLSTHWLQPLDTAAMDFSLFDVLARQVADLIERIRAGQALRASEERLREADLRKDEFLATLAHELRNPLATIRSAVSLLGRPEIDADMPAVHAMLQRQVEHMVRLIDDLMEVSRISRGVIELERQPLDLAAIVRETVDAARPAIEQAGLRVGIELPAGPMPLQGDKVRLAQVLSNLVSNAIRYTDPGGRVDVVGWMAEGRAFVAITDTGIGIAGDKLPGLFTMFRQIDRRDVRSQGGLGIGLSLAQRLAQMHGGAIRAESAGLGRGSRFILELPLSSPRVDAVAEAPAEADAAPRRVLVVDDNHDAADSTAMLLRAAGAEVRVDYDGPSALDTLRAWRPEVVLLDVGMPGMDGLEVARRIREQPALDDLRLVALTGWGQSEDIARTRASGFDTHLVKPAGLAELMQALQGAAPVGGAPV